MTDNDLTYIAGKHKCGIQLNSTRKLIAKRLDDTKGKMKNFFTEKHSVKETIVPRIVWLKGSQNVCNEHGLPYAEEAFQHSLVSMTKNHAALRAIQHRVNKLRKFLGDRDPNDICSCAAKHFCQDTIAWHEFLAGNLRKAFECESIAVTGAGDRNQLHHDHEDCFWYKLDQLDRQEIAVDHLLLLIVDMRQSTELAEKYEITQNFLEYLDEERDEQDRFEPEAFGQILEQIEIFMGLRKCAELLAGGDPDWMPRRMICHRPMCGLHGLVDNIFHSEPYLAGVYTCEFRDLSRLAVDNVLYSSEGLVDMRDVGQALVRYYRATVDLHACHNNAFEETIDYIELVCNSKVQNMLQKAEPEVEARMPMSLTEEIEPISRLSVRDIEEVPYKHSRNAEIAVIVDVDKGADDKENKPPTISRQHVGSVKNSKSAIPIHECDDQQSPQIQVPDSLDSVLFRQTNKKRKASLSEIAERQSKSKTINKYHARGYGREFDQPRRSFVNEEEVHTRKWFFTNQRHYHQVWRVIFPRTKEDRKNNFVPWNMFVSAMQAAPISCRLKRADSVEFVFERFNSSGGREVFQCHAPHQLDWIHQDDLFRYRKDLMYTFGLDAERLFLNGEAVSRKQHNCDD